MKLVKIVVICTILLPTMLFAPDASEYKEAIDAFIKALAKKQFADAGDQLTALDKHYAEDKDTAGFDALEEELREKFILNPGQTLAERIGGLRTKLEDIKKKELLKKGAAGAKPAYDFKKAFADYKALDYHKAGGKTEANLAKLEAKFLEILAALKAAGGEEAYKAIGFKQDSKKWVADTATFIAHAKAGFHKAAAAAPAAGAAPAAAPAAAGTKEAYAQTITAFYTAIVAKNAGAAQAELTKLQGFIAADAANQAKQKEVIDYLRSDAVKLLAKDQPLVSQNQPAIQQVRQHGKGHRRGMGRQGGMRGSKVEGMMRSIQSLNAGGEHAKRAIAVAQQRLSKNPDWQPTHGGVGHRKGWHCHPGTGGGGGHRHGHCRRKR